jgi:Transposase DDE domain
MRVASGRRRGMEDHQGAEKRMPWPPREEWLIAEWPEGHDQASDYWISNLPEDAEPEQFARLARLRWKIELDYKQLKGELGLDHYEGRSYRCSSATSGTPVSNQYRCRSRILRADGRPFRWITHSG